METKGKNNVFTRKRLEPVFWSLVTANYHFLLMVLWIEKAQLDGFSWGLSCDCGHLLAGTTVTYKLK